MNFKTYDILASVIPGFLLLLVLFNFLQIQYDKDSLIAYIAVAFLLGYLINAISSWLEGLYYLTWGGKPSNNLLDGKDTWKVKFYCAEEVKNLLIAEANNKEATNGELFSIAMRNIIGLKDSRVEDFSAWYAFSRSLLTTALLSTVILLTQNYANWIYYAVLIPILLITWLRCKQRSYYYSREVLNEYLNKKLSTSS